MKKIYYLLTAILTVVLLSAFSFGLMEPHTSQPADFYGHSFTDLMINDAVAFPYGIAVNGDVNGTDAEFTGYVGVTGTITANNVVASSVTVENGVSADSLTAESLTIGDPTIGLKAGDLGGFKGMKFPLESTCPTTCDVDEEGKLVFCEDHGEHFLMICAEKLGVFNWDKLNP